MYKNLFEYTFKNKIIEDSFRNKKEFYYLGYKSIESYIIKVIYDYVSINNSLDFCCSFDLLQKVVKKLTSKDYIVSKYNLSEKYIYSFIGAVICDDETIIYQLVDKIYHIEEFLLSIYKKKDNKYLFVKKWFSKLNYNLVCEYEIADKVTCTCRIDELNIYFTNNANSKIEAKYLVVEEIATYLIDHKIAYNIKDIVGEYNIDDSIDKLDDLYEKGYLNKINYLFIEHSEFENIKYEVKCSVDGLNFYAVKIHSNKESAKKLAAYSMLEMIVMQFE